jgi:D-xylose 1-dehydrogenase (NADP+, D-xylono-1,5-lactone-forming)
VSVRFGILSTARINELVLAGARRSDDVEVIAVASRSQERATEYARANGIERAYGSYEELLQDGDVEAIYISLPNRLHVEWSARALAAGKHVLCEKPLARLRAEAERAFDAADRANRILAEAFMYRHHPQTLRVKELVEGGAIGRMCLIRAAFSFTIAQPDDARLLETMEGGSLMDVGCYCVNLARFLAGEPTRVQAEQIVNEDGVDLRFSGTMRFAGEVLAQFDSGLDIPERMLLEIVGTTGTIDVRDPWHDLEPLIEIRTDGDVERIETEALDSYRLELEGLAAAVRGERKPLLGREDAVGQAGALEALYRAAESGLPVNLK